MEGDVIVNIDVSGIIDKLDDIEVILTRMIGYVYDIQVYIRVMLWCIGVGVSFAIAYWIYKTFVRGLIRQYWKLNI